MDKMRQAMTDFVSEFVWREAQEELFSTKSGWNIQAGLESVKKSGVASLLQETYAEGRIRKRFQVSPKKRRSVNDE